MYRLKRGILIPRVFWGRNFNSVHKIASFFGAIPEKRTMKICQTPYYFECVGFFRQTPESAYATFTDEGEFSYINEELNLAISVCRTSKSNYDVTVIVDGTVATITEHSLADACTRARNAIINARKG